LDDFIAFDFPPGIIININTELDAKVMPGQELVEISREEKNDP